VRTARAASALGLLPFQLTWLSQIDFRIGDWAAAYAGADEAVRLAEETSWLTEIPNAFIALAQVVAGQGRVEECRAHANAALGMAEGVGAVLVEVRALSVLGMLELGMGQSAAAVEPLQRAVTITEHRVLREPACIDATADLVEAYLRMGRDDDAAATLKILEGQAQQTRLPSVRARAERCRGMLAHGEAGQAHFVEALKALDEVTMPFERARTELCYGEALRRNKQRAAAARWLRQAVATFERLGADPWVRRAVAELRACGEQARRRDRPASRQLTPQELQVALEVAKGLSNQEVATALFLSTKTVEFHLGNVYRKLGIRSRAQLAYMFATERDRDDAES
jgi:DNA-binding CsgD family transcriptional regulator